MNVRIRHADPSDAGILAAIHVAAWEASYRGIMPDEEFKKRPLERRQVQWRDWLARDDRVTLVAQDEANKIFGFAGGWVLQPPVDGFESYLATLYLQPEVKRRGVGTALLRAIAREFIVLGAANMVLRTLRLNTARMFYEKHGARLVWEGVQIDAGQFDDVVYAFDDLKDLAQASIPRPSFDEAPW